MHRRAYATKLLFGILALATMPVMAAAESVGSDAQAELSASVSSRAVVVSGPVISVSPLALDFGVVSTGAQASRQYTIQNLGDADLEVTSISTSDPQITTTAPLPLVIPAGGSFPATATYQPSGGALLATLGFQSNARNGAFSINATGRGNTGPVLDPIADRTAIAFTELRFTVTATDLDSDPITFSVQGLPAGATFDEATGEFAWTPGLSDGGVHSLTFVVTDGFASDSKTVAITVTVLSHPPVLEQPVSMAVVALGTADQPLIATDPDGDALSFFKVAGPSYATVITTDPGPGSAMGKVYLEPGILASAMSTVVVGVSDGMFRDEKSFNVSIVVGAEGGSFGAATGYGSMAPGGIAIGDLNGDGRLDVVKADIVANTIFILSGNGDGSFGAATEFSMGRGPSQVAIGDLNGDGWPDLAIVSVESNSVSILLNASGSFGDKTDFEAGTDPRTIVLGDLNADGHLDIVVSNPSSNAMSVLLGNGDGTFGARIDSGVGISPTLAALGDLNGDGWTDLAVTAAPSNQVAVLLGHGDGTFGVASYFPTGVTPIGVAIGDLNGDRALDLAVANIGSGSVSVFRGDGRGGFGAKTDYFTGCEAATVAMGDLNGDGRLDLAVANGCSGSVSVLLGNGDGTLRRKTDYWAGGGFVAIRDLNGDSRLDLVMAGSASAFSVLLNIGPAPEEPMAPVLSQPADVSMIAGETKDQELRASDANGDSLTFSMVSGPAYMTVITVDPLAGSGWIHLAPGSGDVGTTVAQVRVTDGTLSDQKSFGITVTLAPAAPFCGPSRPHRVLVDASRDGGLWWSPQGPVFDPCAVHQFMGIADFLRSKGLEVDELPRPFVITPNLLEKYDFVIRFAGVGVYAVSEIEAYREFVSNGGRLILVAHYQRPGTSDPLAEAFGLSFRGIARGEQSMARFAPHPITQNVSSMSYAFGSGIFGTPPGATILGWMSDGTYIDLNFNSVRDPGEPTGVPGMGILTLGAGDVFFIGCVSSFSQPFLSNLIGFFMVDTVALDLDPNTINLKSHAPWVTAYIEPLGFDPANIDIASLRLAGSVPVVGGKAEAVGDHDGDGLPDLSVKFSRHLLDPLLVPGMNRLVVTGTLVSGENFEGTDSVRVIEPQHQPNSASVSPNPLNPVGVLTINTAQAGPVSIKLFDIQGRLVRRLIQAQPFAEGSHEVLIDGRGEAGQPLASGVYLYRVEAPGGNVTGRFAVLK